MNHIVVASYKIPLEQLCMLISVENTRLVDMQMMCTLETTIKHLQNKLFVQFIVYLSNAVSG